MNTQTKHTPGPWAVMDNTAEPFGQLLVESERDGAVALCYTVERDETAAPLECIENARLIAAAPDLLAALQDLLSAIEETYDNRHEIRAAQDAIAKAIG